MKPTIKESAKINSIITLIPKSDIKNHPDWVYKDVSARGIYNIGLGDIVFNGREYLKVIHINPRERCFRGQIAKSTASITEFFSDKIEVIFVSNEKPLEYFI